MSFTAQIDALVGHGGCGPTGVSELGYLMVSKFLGLFCIQLKEAELAALAQYDEFTIRLNERAATVLTGRWPKLLPRFILVPQ